MKKYRKTTKDDHYPEPATHKRNRIPIQTDNILTGEKLKAAIIDQAIQDGS